MYLRMLKKDLRDKIGVNIVLCLFMIISATVVIMSVGFVYTFIAGIDRTYDKCKTTDGLFTVSRSVSDEDKNRKVIEDTLKSYPEVSDIFINDSILLGNSRMNFEGIDKRNVSGLYERSFLVYKVSTERNIPYNMDDDRFTLSDGCVAIPQTMASSAGIKVGTKFFLTTDMGNTYEFIVSEIYKDPSTAALYKILFSDGDFERILEESGNVTNLYEINYDSEALKRSARENLMAEIRDSLMALSKDGKIDGSITDVMIGKSNTATDEAAISLIISIFMMLMGIALILIIFMSIRFSLSATVKREEKEIGTMKAIGVDSISYRTLFIVKYIAFGIIGSIIGLFVGIPISKKMISRFLFNTVGIDDGLFVALGLIAGMIFILMMVLFSFVALKRINRISVMDTIHGENRGERFSKISGIHFYKSKKMKLPFFLALEDIIRKMKRYIYIVISYTLGLTILFTIFQLKDTLVSDIYRRKYWGVADREVFIRPEENLRLKFIEKTGSYRNTILYYEEYYNEHGIPLDIQILDIQNGSVIADDKNIAVDIYHGDYDIKKLEIVNGGKVPELQNEIAVSHFMKDEYGIKLGDVITLEYRVYKEDGISEEVKRKDFIVTAYVERLGTDNSQVYINNTDENMVLTGEFTLFNQGLNCTDDEYYDYIEKMRAVNKDILIWDYDRLLDYDMGDMYGTILNMLAVITGSIVFLMVFAMTFLYQQIFIEEETSDIAMLKSLGVDGKDIKKWQYIRIMILVVVASFMAILLSFTVMRMLFNMIGKAALNVGQFMIVTPPVGYLLLLPMGLAVLVTVILYISFKPIDRIKIWKVREE